MPRQSERDVQPNRQHGGWDVVRPGHKRASAHAATRAEAVQEARRIVKNAGGGEIRIKNEFGKLIDRDTIGGTSGS